MALAFIKVQLQIKLQVLQNFDVTAPWGLRPKNERTQASYLRTVQELLNGTRGRKWFIRRRSDAKDRSTQAQGSVAYSSAE